MHERERIEKYSYETWTTCQWKKKKELVCRAEHDLLNNSHPHGELPYYQMIVTASECSYCQSYSLHTRNTYNIGQTEQVECSNAR